MPQTERYRNVTTSSNPQQIRFDTADPRYKLARKVDTGSGSYGSTSPFRDPRRLSGETNNRFRGTDPGFGRGSWNWTGDGVKEASQRSTNKAVTVSATTVPGSTQQTLGNRARVSISNAVDRFGKGVSAAKGSRGGGSTVSSGANSAAKSTASSSASSAVGKGVSAVAKSVSSSASGDVSFGAYKGGVGIGVSRGGLDLGVGFASVSYNFSNPNESSIGGFFNTTTITGTQEGCTIFLDYKFLGKKYFTETRQADECSKGEEDNNEDEDINSPVPDPSDSSDEWQGDAVPTPRTWSVPEDYKESRCKVWEEIRYGKYIPSPNDSTAVRVEWKIFMIPRGYIQNGASLPYLNFVWGQTKGNYFNLENALFSDIEDLVYDGNKLTYKVRYDRVYMLPEGNKPLEIRSGGRYYYGRFAMQASSLSGYYDFSNDCFSQPTLKLPKKITVPTSRGVLEPVDNRQQILVERIYRMLGGDTFWEKGLMIPNSLFIPGGQDMFKMKTYNEIMNIIFRTFSHRTIGEIEFTIADSNKGAKGNQAINVKTLNAQGYFTNLFKTIAESKAENTDQLNVLVRLGLITSQLMKVLVIASENIKSIIGYLGVPQKDSLEKVDIPFDLSLNGQLTKGFQTREDLQKELLKIVDADTEQAIEGILDRFLDEWQMPVKVRKLRSSKEGGDFWFWLRQNLPK